MYNNGQNSFEEATISFYRESSFFNDAEKMQKLIGQINRIISIKVK